MGVAVGVGVGVDGVGVGVGVAVAVGVAVGVGVGVGPDCAQYFPPVLKRLSGRYYRPRRSFRCRSTLPWAVGLIRCVHGACSCPTVRPGSYLPPVLKYVITRAAAPDDHLAPVQTAVWACRPAGALAVLVALQLSVPGLYLPPVFNQLSLLSRATPNDHFAASPHRPVGSKRPGRICWVRRCPAVAARIVSAAGVKDSPNLLPPQTIISLPIQTAPWGIRAVGALVVLWRSTYRFQGCICRRCSILVLPPSNPRPTQSFRYRSTLPCALLAAIRCIGGAGSYPAIGTGIVSAARVPIVVNTIEGIPSPNDHFAPCPYCPGKLSSCRGPHRGRSRPAIRARIVFPASVREGSRVETKRNNPAPDDHLTASPHCCMIASADSRSCQLVSSYW